MTDLLLADYAIRQLHGRYIDAVWRKDMTAFTDCFAQDAEWKIAGIHMRGRAEITATADRLIPGSQRVLMFIGMPVLDIGQGTASGRVHVTEYVKRPDGDMMRTIGVYYDHYVGEGPDWRFQSRYWSLFYRGPGDFSAEFFAGPEFGPPPGMPGPDEPSVTN